MAKTTGSELVIVNVINRRDIDTLQKAAGETRGFSVRAWLEKQKEARQAPMQKLIEETGCGGLSIKTVLLHGLPFRELIKAINEQDVDLVVMGVKGRGNAPGVLVGSTAEKLFRRCPVPMLNVRTPEHRKTLAAVG